VRWAYEGACNRGDVDAMLTLASEDIVIRPSGKILDIEHEYRGHEGVRRFWRDVSAPWDQLSIEVDAKFGQIATMEDDVVTSVVAYADWESAAAVAGVEL
jgi:ketosteroid isomerase-like protein